MFFDSRETQAQIYPWLAFVDFDESLDVEIKSSLMSAAGKQKITPEILNDGFRTFLHSIMRNIRSYVGAKPANIILERTREEMGKQFPRRHLDIEWELLNV